MGGRRRWTACFFAIFIALTVCGPASAATINVDPNAGEGTPGDQICSLREAITAANADSAAGDCEQASGADTIAVPAGLYQMTTNGAENANATGDFDITASVTISGAGSATTTIDAQQNDRVFDILSGTVAISGVTVTGGKSPDAPVTFGDNFGGGIRHTDGSLALSGVTVTGNVAGVGAAGVLNLHQKPAPYPSAYGGAGGFGGGIYSSGPALTITGSTISQNTAGNGGNGGNTSDGAAGQGGSGGSGGGIAVAPLISNFALTITDTTITDNTAGNAGDGGTASTNAGTGAQGGSGGSGGGLSFSATNNSATATFSGLTVTGNHGGTGGAAASPYQQSAAGGSGGGLNLGGYATLTDSNVSQNQAGAGGAGGGTIRGGTGGSGGGITTAYTVSTSRSTVSGNVSGAGGASGGIGGDAGGIYLSGSSGSISRSTISGNATGAGADYSVNFAGFGGAGGGVYIGAPATITNSTVANNTTGAGGNYTGAGCPNYSSGSQSGRAAGIMMIGTTSTLTHVTVAGNFTGAGGNGSCNANPTTTTPSPRGGINISSGGTMTMSNSIVAQNMGGTPNQCFLESVPQGFTPNTIVNGGGNLYYPTDYYHQCPGRNADPKLGPLADNGGTTLTMRLLDGSGAIDIGAAAKCLTIDQRGTDRPQGIACDAGAFEKQQPPVTPPSNTGTNTTPTETTTSPTGTPPPAAGPTPDTTPPVVKLLLTKQRLRKALKKGYVARFSTNEPGKATCTVFLKSRKVARGKMVVSAAGNAKCVARFTKKAKKALAKKRSVKLRLLLVATDTAGNATKKTASFTLKR